jgi:thiamine-monophosphate kinase
MDQSESEFLRWLQRRVPRGAGVQVGIGDDAAVLQPPHGGALVMASDQTVEGVHFLRAEASWKLVGRKALARNLSDLAAMGARPWVALLSAALPADLADEVVRELFEGVIELAEQESTSLVGGDLCRSTGGVSLDVSVVGCMEGRDPLLRSGARVGDELLVTGDLGGSRRGHHLRFQPRWREAIALADSGAVHAAIDLSDGLGRDLPQLAEASHVGFVLEVDRLPRRSDTAGNPESVSAALNDGEDFELLLAVQPGFLEELRALPELEHTALTRIGVVTQEGQSLQSGDGSVTPLVSGGYEHRFDH